VVIWSDGGPSHFKTHNTQYQMSIIQEQFPQQALSWNMFWAYRGHNMCDGHAGVTATEVIVPDGTIPAKGKGGIKK